MRQSLELNAPTPEAMAELGARLGRAFSRLDQAPIVVGVEGDLGAGKTTLVAGALRALGVAGPIRSPTYTLVEPYDLRDLQVHHIDLYRLVSADEVESLGLRDLLQPRTVLLIEWPSKGGAAAPAADLQVDIAYAGESQGRHLRFTPRTQCGDKLLRQMFPEKPELSRVSP